VVHRDVNSVPGRIRRKKSKFTQKEINEGGMFNERVRLFRGCEGKEGACISLVGWLRRTTAVIILHLIRSGEFAVDPQAPDVYHQRWSSSEFQAPKKEEHSAFRVCQCARGCYVWAAAG
jgi:hypothetical protein